MAYTRPKPGQPLDMTETAAIWSDIVDVLNAWNAGKLGDRAIPKAASPQISIVNTSEEARAPGEILALDDLPSIDSGLAETLLESPTIDAIDPVWHTSIDSLIVCHGGCPVDSAVQWNPRSWGVVSVTIEDSADRYVMLDPDNVNKMKTADAGIWKILGLDETNDFAVVDFTQSQNLWRYELTQNSAAPSTTEAKLIRIDGAEFAAEINLSDPLGLMDDQVIGDEGWCVHVGNQFQAIQGPC